jgi:hypothetical protein
MLPPLLSSLSWLVLLVDGRIGGIVGGGRHMVLSFVARRRICCLLLLFVVVECCYFVPETKSIDPPNRDFIDLEPWRNSAEKMVVGFVTLVRQQWREVSLSVNGRRKFWRERRSCGSRHRHLQPPSATQTSSTSIAATANNIININAVGNRRSRQ